jgi:hypothetical protein
MNLLNYPLVVTIFTVYAITIIFVIEYTLTHIYFNKDKYDDDMINNGLAISNSLSEEKVNPVKELALKLTSYFRNNVQMK